MPTNVDVPALGESVQEATLIKWHKNDGDPVSAAEPLAELETDKANVDVPSPAAGILRRVKKEGETVTIGETIAKIEEGNGAAVTKKASTASGGPAAPPRESVAPKAAEPAKSGKPAPSKPEDMRPSVRRIVEEKNLDPSKIQGTAKGGQITKEDAERAAEGSVERAVVATPSPTPPPAAAATATPSAEGGIRRVPMTRIRKRIAQNLVQAQHTAAILHTYNEIDLQAVSDLRTRYKETFEKTHGVGLGFMSFFARAVVLALQKYPNVNASVDGDDVVYHDYVNLGIAVSTERGLVVPILKNVQDMSFAKIESEIKRVALAARDGKLALEELSGGTFTITNGGVFGSLLSTPILLPPQSGILGMHAIKKRPVVVDDQIVVRPMMYIVLGYDHRLIDGRESVSFLVKLKEYLEDPARLMLEV
ncbi:MAG TPA: 2-oxoglutarate dehydrogenase complex dihydrolipoyllysine-residue succinyltransferase [Tepidisphaeraceae bacterium]|jgi:2-oxoglutarate dehydrogenase E2 component (dihydrolipoamide succinyltransferase)